MMTGWILSFSLTLIVFLNNYLPTGLSLIDGIFGQKLLIAVPVLSVMGVAFFAMTLLIVGGIINLSILGLFITLGGLLNFLLVLLGGSGGLKEVIKASLYSSIAVLVGLLNIFLLIAVKYKLMSVGAWIMFERIVFLAVSIYLFYLFVIIGEKTHKCKKWQAFLAATVPFVLLVLFNIVFSGKILPKAVGILG